MTDDSSNFSDQTTPGPAPVAIVVSQYNAQITGALETGAVETYLARSGSREHLTIIETPGAFELPAVAAELIDTGDCAGVCCLGCIVRGETNHDQHIAGAIASAIADLSARTGVPCSFGVLTVNNIDQARARAGGGIGNKGAESMHALLDTIDALGAIRSAGATGYEHRLGRPVADKSGGDC